MKPGRLWPVAIVGLLGMNMTIVGVTVYYASRDKTSAVVPDYYMKAVHWDETARQAAANRALGWTVGVTVVPATGDSTARSATLTVTLADGAGRKIRAAAASVEAFHEADPTAKVRGALRPLGDGRYEAVLPIARAGLWRVDVAADAAGMKFTNEQSVEVRGVGTQARAGAGAGGR